MPLSFLSLSLYSYEYLYALAQNARASPSEERLFKNSRFYPLQKTLENPKFHFKLKKSPTVIPKQNARVKEREEEIENNTHTHTDTHTHTEREREMVRLYVVRLLFFYPCDIHVYI
jgi:hypothetical protein